MTNVRFLAHYLPQYYPIKENNEWWGKGFTEWFNVAKAKSLFQEHRQPKIPTDLGFYDLRLPQVRMAQAEMAQAYGIEGFIYWHYWFSGDRLLSLPFNEVLKSGKPDYPFCLAWANHSWTGEWGNGDTKRILKEQVYPGEKDHINHFKYLLESFRDDRYFRVNNKPLFFILKPLDIPDIGNVINLWRNLACDSGLDGLYLVGYHWNDPTLQWCPVDSGFDASTFAHQSTIKRHFKEDVLDERCKNGFPRFAFHYKEALPCLLNKDIPKTFLPSVVPNWDNSPRYGKDGMILYGSTPELFEIHLKQALSLIESKNESEKIVFIKSWNEWAEGNYIEPDLEFGHGYLEVIKKVCDEGI